MIEREGGKDVFTVSARIGILSSGTLHALRSSRRACPAWSCSRRIWRTCTLPHTCTPPHTGTWSRTCKPWRTCIGPQGRNKTHRTCRPWGTCTLLRTCTGSACRCMRKPSRTCTRPHRSKRSHRHTWGCRCKDRHRCSYQRTFQ